MSDIPPTTTLKRYSARNMSTRSVGVCHIIFTKNAASMSCIECLVFGLETLCFV